MVLCFAQPASGGWSLPQTFFDGWDPPKIVYNCKFKNVKLSSGDHISFAIERICILCQGIIMLDRKRKVILNT